MTTVPTSPTTVHDGLLPFRLARTKPFCPICINLHPSNYHPSLPAHHAYSARRLQYLGFSASPDLLQIGEARGCKICSVLLDGIMLYRGVWERVPERELCMFVRRRRDGRVAVEVEARGEFGEGCVKMLELEFYTPDDQPKPWRPAFGRLADIPVSPLSTETLEFIRDSVDECRFSHPQCQSNLETEGGQAESQPNLPAYIIDLGSPKNRQDPILIQPSPGSKGIYATLSYSQTQTSTLSSSKLPKEDQPHRLPLRTLPRTFQDAITLTRALNLRYLWISALCASENDPIDAGTVHQETSDVLRHSFLNIAATRTSSIEEGFLGPRNSKSREISVIRRDGKEGYVKVRESICHDDFGDSATKKNACSLSVESLYTGQKAEPQTALLDSATFLLERLIAPRTVHFTPRETVFECGAHMKCECSSKNSANPAMPLKAAFSRILNDYPLEPRRNSCGTSNAASLALPLIRITDVSVPLSRHSSSPSIHSHTTSSTGNSQYPQSIAEAEVVPTDEIWSRLISLYTSKLLPPQLSNGTQSVLAPLVPLARLLSRLDLPGHASNPASPSPSHVEMPTTATHNHYISGLWQSQLPDSLTWLSLSSSHCHRTKNAPTFSWASRWGRIGWFGRDEAMRRERWRPEMQVLGSSWIASRPNDGTLDEFTGNEEAWLRVRARKATVRVGKRAFIGGSNGGDEGEKAFRCWVEWPRRKDSVASMASGESAMDGVKMAHLYVDAREDAKLFYPGQEVLLLVVGCYESTKQIEESDTSNLTKIDEVLESEGSHNTAKEGGGLKEDVVALVVKTSDKVPGAVERVGLVVDVDQTWFEGEDIVEELLV